MKKLMFALACAASAAVMGADTLNNKATFEAFDAGTTAAALADKTDANDPNGSKFWALAVANNSAADESVVTAYETAPAADNSKYLKLETNGNELQRKVKPDGAAFAVGDGLYIDTLVQFTATPADSAPTIDAGAKLAIWLEGKEDTGYQLKVAGACIDFVNDSPLGVSSTYVLTGTTSILPDTWYRLTVKSLSGVFNVDGIMVPGFQVYINGKRLTINAASFTDNLVNAIDTLVSASQASWITDGKSFVTGNAPSFIPSAMCASEGYSFATVAALTSVGFQGSGAIDNVTITDEDLYPDVVPSVEFTLTINFGDGVSAVSYTIGNETTDVTTSGTIVEKLPEDTVVSIAAKTVADWFVAPAATEVTMTENKTVTVSATPATAADIDVNVPEGTAAETVTAALAWAKAAGKSTTAVEGAANLLNNYLLNVTDLDVEPQIKIVSIDTTTTPVTVTAEVTDENGKTIKTLTTEGNNKINASIKYKAAPTLEALKTVQPKESIGDNDQFIQVVVE